MPTLLPPGGMLWEINKPLLTQSNKMQVLSCCFLVLRVIVIRASSATCKHKLGAQIKFLVLLSGFKHRSLEDMHSDVNELEES